MCIVIDANAAHHLRSDDVAGAAVLRWLLRGRGKLVVSNELLKELSVTHFRATLVVLDRARKIIRANEHRCAQQKQMLINGGQMRSDDEHVLALVSTTACDVVFTHDQALHEDLKNKSIIAHHCSIFQYESHQHLLGECRC